MLSRPTYLSVHHDVWPNKSGRESRQCVLLWLSQLLKKTTTALFCAASHRLERQIAESEGLGVKQKQGIGWDGGREGWIETGRGGGSRITPWMCVKLPRQLDRTGKTGIRSERDVQYNKH